MDKATIDEAKRVDLLQLISSDTQLKRVANTGGGEYAGACPFCGGRDRFRVQPIHQPYPRWLCRGCSEMHWSSAIDYVMRREKVPFADAVAKMTGESKQTRSIFMPSTAKTAIKHQGPPSSDWQVQAQRACAQCMTILWQAEGERARRWLVARGVEPETLAFWHIGFNPKPQKIANLFLPRGIVIPCEIRGTIWGIKIRGAQDNRKYTHVKGSRPALFGAETLGQRDYAVVTEGELDALLTWQILQHAENPDLHKVGVCTLGSATNPLDLWEWAEYLLPISRFLVCYDADAEGERGAERWSNLSQRTRRVNIPRMTEGDKDLTDYHLGGGRILDLIASELARDQWASGGAGGVQTSL